MTARRTPTPHGSHRLPSPLVVTNSYWIKVSKTGQVVYKSEKDACRAFPDPGAADLASGARRNFQVLSPLDFLAEFTQHIPPKGAHLIRFASQFRPTSRAT